MTSRILPLAIVLVALAVRLAYLVGGADNPTHELPIVDAATYHFLAKGLVEHREMGERFFWQPFPYTAFLSATYAMCGYSSLCVRLLQAVAGTLTCLLVCLVGRRLFSPTVGAVGGLITACYGPLIFFRRRAVGNDFRRACRRIAAQGSVVGSCRAGSRPTGRRRLVWGRFCACPTAVSAGLRAVFSCASLDVAPAGSETPVPLCCSYWYRLQSADDAGCLSQ